MLGLALGTGKGVLRFPDLGRRGVLSFLGVLGHELRCSMNRYGGHGCETEQGVQE